MSDTTTPNTGSAVGDGEPTNQVLVGFEADDIQRYIMQRNPLRQMVGASAIIEALGATGPDSLICTLFAKLDITPIAWGRSGGGGFVVQLPDENAATRLLTAWPLVVDRQAPGLPFVLEMVTATHVYTAWLALRSKMRQGKQQPSLGLPPYTLAMQYEPRSSQALAAGGKMSHQSQRKHAAAVVPGDNQRTLDVVAGVLNLQGAEGVTHLWPRDMSTAGQKALEGTDNGVVNDVILFPHRNKAGQAITTVGVIHIDGNGFGLLGDGLASLKGEDKPKILAAQAGLSALITTICHTAANAAVNAVLLADATAATEYIIPARPLILAGEDVSIIVRSDLALPFVKKFLETFEAASIPALGHLKTLVSNWPGLPEKLTACAGVALVAGNYPFDLAHQLAEELCSQAKVESKRYSKTVGPGTVVFKRVTSALQDESSGLNRAEMTVGVRHIQLGQLAYAVEPATSAIATTTPTLASLLGFVAHLQSQNDEKNSARTLIGRMAETSGLHPLNADYARITKKYTAFNTELLKVAASGKSPQQLTGLPFLSWADQTTTAPSDEAVTTESSSPPLGCPLHDALSLVAAAAGEA